MIKKLLFKKNKYYGFTLVELIIVITILAILATIAFVSFSGYTGNSRDSNRLFSIKEISKSLIIQKELTGNFPVPDTIYATGGITALNANLFNVGIIGKGVSNYIKLGSIPLDPKSKNEYSYGLTKDNKYFQVAGTLENGEVLGYKLVSQTYANGELKAAVEGNYKGVLKFTHNSKNYIGRIPSLIYSRDGTYEGGDNVFVLNNEKNLPYKVNENNLGAPKILTSTGVEITTSLKIDELVQSNEWKDISKEIIEEEITGRPNTGGGLSSGGGGGSGGGANQNLNKCQLPDGIESFGIAYSKGTYNSTLDLCECGAGELYNMQLIVNEWGYDESRLYNYGYNNGSYTYFNTYIKKIENSIDFKVYDDYNRNIINGTEFENKSSPGFCSSQVTRLNSNFEINKNIVGTNCNSNSTPKEFFRFDKNTGLIYGYDFLNGPMDVVVPCEIDGVKVIGIDELGLASVLVSENSYGFGQNKFLTSLFLPNTIQYLGSQSLAYNQIPTIDLPKSVKYIYYGIAGDYYESLTNKTRQITCGGGYDDIKYIDYNAFSSPITGINECIYPRGDNPIQTY